MFNDYYDIIIIGTGAGGGTLAHRLAPTGKKILILERGPFLPKEKENWDPVAVYQKDRYHNAETWYNASNGQEIHPGTGYWVGGNTKVYGGALLRFRERDFDRVEHKEGISPEWVLKYQDFEPYYTEAEHLYRVHGQRGEDPTEPPTVSPYPFPPVSHEPRIEEIHQNLQKKGLNPIHLPLAIDLNEVNRQLGACIRCNTCDGFPCLVNGKSDADINCIRPAATQDNVFLTTEAEVLRLYTSSSGREVTGIEVKLKDEVVYFSSDIVVVSCGAINSAALLLRSANDQHPKGLANSSDLVGRNFMKHQHGAIIGLTSKPNQTVFQKTLAILDYYWGEPGFEYPMGLIQLLGKVSKDIMATDAPGFSPGIALDVVAQHSVDWFITAEDLPDLNNRVTYKNGSIHLQYTENNTIAFQRLMARWIEILKSIDCGEMILPVSLYFRKKLLIAAVAHQNGTCRFGNNPQDSVLDVNCRTHDLDNLYVVDGSFFPSCAAVNPTLTIIANSLRVGDHIASRLK